MDKNDFMFIVFADEPFTSLGVPKIHLPIPAPVFRTMAKAVDTGREVPFDLPTLRDFVAVCCREHPELADKCMPAKCCIAFLFGRRALDTCGQMLSSAEDIESAPFVNEYSTVMRNAMEQLLLACDLCDKWTDAPLHLQHNCHWQMARFYMLAHSEQDAITELEKVIAICGSYDLVPDVWLALSGIRFNRNEPTRARALLEDYVHRAKTLFPERTTEFLSQGRNGQLARAYPQVKQFFDELQQ